MAATAQITTWDERLRRALNHAGLSLPQAFKKLGWKRDSHPGQDMRLCDVVDFAQLLDVDPVWLMRGVPSPAAVSAVNELRRLRKAGKGNFERMKQADFEILLDSFEVLPQPPLAEPEWLETCRYCGCTTDMACAEGCEWIDKLSTICSACLQPGE